MNVFIGSDTIVRMSNLKDEISGGGFVNNATVTATLKTTAGVEVGGQTFPATLTYVTASDGIYEGVLEDGLSLTEGTLYFLEVTADAGADKIGFWRRPILAKYKT